MILLLLLLLIQLPDLPSSLTFNSRALLLLLLLSFCDIINNNYMETFPPTHRGAQAAGDSDEASSSSSRFNNKYRQSINLQAGITHLPIHPPTKWSPRNAYGKVHRWSARITGERRVVPRHLRCPFMGRTCAGGSHKWRTNERNETRERITRSNAATTDFLQ